MKYWQALANTALISLLVSVLQIISCTLVGYGFARYKFPLKGLWFAAVILVIVVPPTTIQASLFLNFRFFDIFGIIELISRTTWCKLIEFFDTICFDVSWLYGSEEWFVHLHDSSVLPWNSKRIGKTSYVDGCGKLSTFVRIMLPDAKPILTSCFLFSYVWQWTDSFYSNLFFQFRICSVVQ